MLRYNEFINESNQSLKLNIYKNPESAPYLGSIFGQDVEAKGTYVSVGESTLPTYLPTNCEPV